MRMRLALLALLVAAPAWGAGSQGQDGKSARGQMEVPVVGGWYRSDTTYRAETMDANGNLYTRESAPIFDQNGVSQAVINNSGLAVAGLDSSAVIDVHKYRVVGLFIKGVPSTGTGGINRFAFQIRAHLNGQSDSSSTFAWYPQVSANAGAGVAAAGADVDTLYRLGHLITPAATTLGSGEFSVVFNRVRNAPANGVAATIRQYPSGIYLQLSSVFGCDFWAPYMSVRVANLVGPTCAITVHIVGTPL